MPFAALRIEVAVARERSMSENIFNPAADLARNGRIENLFPTPLFSYVFKDVELPQCRASRPHPRTRAHHEIGEEKQYRRLAV